MSIDASQIKNELALLHKEMNACLSTELHYILQPEYRTKNKARQLIDTINTLVVPISQVLIDPSHVHETELDDAMKQQVAVIDQLKKDYPQADNQTALEEAATHLKATYQMIKKLREEVPKPALVVTEKAQAIKVN